MHPDGAVFLLDAMASAAGPKVIGKLVAGLKTLKFCPQVPVDKTGQRLEDIDDFDKTHERVLVPNLDVLRVAVDCVQGHLEVLDKLVKRNLGDKGGIVVGGGPVGESFAAGNGATGKAGAVDLKKQSLDDRDLMATLGKLGGNNFHLRPEFSKLLHGDLNGPRLDAFALGRGFVRLG